MQIPAMSSSVEGSNAGKGILSVLVINRLQIGGAISGMRPFQPVGDVRLIADGVRLPTIFGITDIIVVVGERMTAPPQSSRNQFSLAEWWIKMSLNPRQGEPGISTC
jgi:hypothetical protein